MVERTGTRDRWRKPEKQRLETSIISSAEARKNELFLEAKPLAYESGVCTLTGGTSVHENLFDVCRRMGGIIIDVLLYSSGVKSLNLYDNPLCLGIPANFIRAFMLV